MTPSITQSNVQAALRSFLLAVLPDGVDVIAAQDNRVPEPDGTEFVVMTPIRFERLRTNIDTAEDVKFTGSITAANMTVTAMAAGSGDISVGATVFGTGVAAITVVVSQTSGAAGGVGVYVVSQAQTLSSRTLSAGREAIEQGSKVTVQLDFHSAGLTAGDMAQTVSTLMRDEFAIRQFEEQDPNYGVVPLLADDPKQVPFINENQQYEWRWVVEALLQANVVLQVPQQFADSVTIGIINVDATYPP